MLIRTSIASLVLLATGISTGHGHAQAFSSTASADRVTATTIAEAAATTHATDLLPDSPRPAPEPAAAESTLSRNLDRAALSFDVSTRILDVISTQQMLHRGGYEKELPPTIVNHPALMLAFEGAVITVEQIGARQLAKHGHRRLARLVPLIDGAGCLATDVSNFRIERPRPRGGRAK